MFLSQMTTYQLGGIDHSVFDTIAQLTEGRSARDQPKQPPAKKKAADSIFLGQSLLFSILRRSNSL